MWDPQRMTDALSDATCNFRAFLDAFNLIMYRKRLGQPVLNRENLILLE